MHVKQIDPTHTPELFFLPRDTGEVDEEENPIFVYDDPHQEEVVDTGKKLKKRAADGHNQSCHMEPSLISFFYDDALAATWRLVPEYWQVASWEEFTKPLEDYLEIVDGHLVGNGTQGAFSWDVNIAWTMGESNWTIDVVSPGFLVRLKWEITFTALGQQLFANEILKVGYGDYTGNTSDDAGDPVRTIIFEPDGVNDGFTF